MVFEMREKCVLVIHIVGHSPPGHVKSPRGIDSEKAYHHPKAVPQRVRYHTKMIPITTA